MIQLLNNCFVLSNCSYLFSIVESCSSDILRNSLRSFFSMEIVSVDQGGKLAINNDDKLFEVIHTLSICKL